MSEPEKLLEEQTVVSCREDTGAVPKFRRSADRPVHGRGVNFFESEWGELFILAADKETVNILATWVERPHRDGDGGTGRGAGL